MGTLINLTGLQNSTTVMDMVNYANQVTNNLGGSMLIFATFFVITISLVRRGYAFSDVLVVSSFICFVLSILARYIGFVSVHTMLLFLIMTAISGFILFFKKTD